MSIPYGECPRHDIYSIGPDIEVAMFCFPSQAYRICWRIVNLLNTSEYPKHRTSLQLKQRTTLKQRVVTMRRDVGCEESLMHELRADRLQGHIFVGGTGGGRPGRVQNLPRRVQTSRLIQI